MGDCEEIHIFYVQGMIEGFLLSEWRRTDEDTAFDPDRWEELYASRIVYDSIPQYPSREARRKGEGAVVLADWEDATETKYLKQGGLSAGRPGLYHRLRRRNRRQDHRRRAGHVHP